MGEEDTTTFCSPKLKPIPRYIKSEIPKLKKKKKF